MNCAVIAGFETTEWYGPAVFLRGVMERGPGGPVVRAVRLLRGAALAPRPVRHRLDRTPLLLQLRPGAVVRGDERGGAQRGHHEARHPSAVVVPVGGPRHRHLR